MRKSTYRLTQEEERKLGLLILEGDKNAVNKLIEANLPFAKSFAANFFYLPIDKDDILAACYEGITKAAIMFNVKKGCKFITYAAFWMRKYILELVDNQIHKDKNGNVVTVYSLDACFKEDEDGCYNDIIPDPESIIKLDSYSQYDRDLVFKRISALPEQDFELLQKYYGLGTFEEETLSSIGQSWGVSREAVRQRLERVKTKIRKSILDNESLAA
ncbi:MAG: sigma-70 family RNA polymerase sigma factor [Bacteroidales bacterium]|nr:sigma-70 family RNA polymerase sigma factor [Bacteroidales bacterium]